MADKIALTIDVTPEQLTRIEQLAQQKGYAAPDDYLLALVDLDVMADAIIDDEPFDFDTKEGVMAGLRESWHQAMTGQTIPTSELSRLLAEDDE